MAVDVRGEIRRFTKQALGSGEKIMRMTGLESQAVAQVEPARTELSRSGRRMVGGTQIIANGIAPVAAIPTTTATLALFNGEQVGSGKSYAIERVRFWLGSGTPAAGATLFACVSTQIIATAPTAMATGYAISRASGGPNSSMGLWTTAVTVPSVPPVAWFPVVSSFQLAAANVGQGDTGEDFEGALIVPPRCCLGFGILSGAGTTPLYGIACSWVELELELE